MSLMGQENERKILSYSDFIKKPLPDDGRTPVYKVELTNGDDVAKIEDRDGEVYFARILISILGAIKI